MRWDLIQERYIDYIFTHEFHWFAGVLRGRLEYVLHLSENYKPRSATVSSRGVVTTPSRDDCDVELMCFWSNNHLETSSSPDSSGHIPLPYNLGNQEGYGIRCHYDRSGMPENSMNRVNMELTSGPEVIRSQTMFSVATRDETAAVARLNISLVCLLLSNIRGAQEIKLMTGVHMSTCTAAGPRDPEVEMVLKWSR